ncbi:MULTISPECIES: ABC transporter ATP-binding protein [Nocardioides]|uniref:ABC-2 type transport system ATP-binding protein n=1 Tax=Nocardioides lianchengensis TaxID=1045774 RepID=A0A1G6LB23_9ACTN|nr:ABC transporter ATP-binding protein [Nocardioides lianchengensis]NYG12623.1 ABC-2 type transport system ATP-binding protein [Nocardioides lianchengensis]SDC40227.1 ABC-2 type transport system ATP-binding protein [Nocardioides lianchengensis]
MDNHTTPALEIRGLRRTYGTGESAYEAVRGVDLTVERGTLLALLGTNGAGKTSTMEVVEGLAAASGGSVRVFGLDPVADRAEARRRTGVVLQVSGFSGDLTVAETLEMEAATVTDPRPVSEVVALVDLEHRVDTKVLSLSGGERRRLDLACALLGKPELLMLDEPTTGLDPESRRRVWELVRNLRDEGAAVLLTTHYLDEAEELADQIAIMHAGRIVREGTLAEVVGQQPSTVRYTTPDGETTTLETEDLQTTLTEVLTWAAEHGVRLSGLDARHASLESTFLAIAGTPRSDDTPATDASTDDLEGAVR